MPIFGLGLGVKSEFWIQEWNDADKLYCKE